MVEEYTSIMRNDVWDILSRPEGKSEVISRWLYKIRHVVDGSIEGGSLMCVGLRNPCANSNKHPRTWYSRIDRYLQSMGFTKNEVDPNLYFILVGSDPLILVLYVDDLFLTGAEELIAR
jgi:hypothetical protein